MSKFFIFEKPDGSLAITQVLDETIDEDSLVESLLNDKNHEDYVLKQKIDYYPPINPDFFKCYVYVEDNVVLDMAKAREHWKNQLRLRRQPMLDSLDIQFQRAIETGDAELQAEITAKKNILRDCTSNPAIDAAQSIFDLKQTLPDLLKE